MDRRSVSTVVDVALAMLLISAAVGVMVVFLNDQGTPPNDQRVDRTAETLASTTVTVEYSIESVESEPLFNGSYPDSVFERQRYGSTLGLLVDAAVANVRVDDRPLTAESEGFGSAVQGNVRSVITPIEGSVHVTAQWRPYPGANIVGMRKAGPEVPGDATVRVAALNVSSGFRPINDTLLSDTYNATGLSGVADLIANRTVRGYFPPAQMNKSLEQDGVERSLAVYRYQRLEDIVQDETSYDPDLKPNDTSNPLSRIGANASKANYRLAKGLSRIVESDLNTRYGGTLTGPELADKVNLGRATVVVHLWNQ